MAVTVRHLYKNSMPQYKMQLVAGGSGINNPVQWVHIVEDEHVGNFLHGDEMVFTTGIRNNSETWLMNFTKNLHDINAGALVVNTGPYIRQIPQEVIDFCDRSGMPLFTIPWTTRIVDMTHNFCELILRSEKAEDSVAGMVKNIIFHTGDREEQILQIERKGFLRISKFCFICISAMDGDIPYTHEKIKELQFPAQIAAKNIHDLFVSFRYNDKLIAMLTDYTEAETAQFLQDYRHVLRERGIKCRVFMGVGANISGIEGQENNLENAILANKIAMRQDITIVYYEQLEIYKLLFAVKNQDVLLEFYDRVLGKLKQYDEANGTKLMEFLRTYIENNANQQLMAEKMFVHRNTVLNQLKKIEKITGYSMHDLESQVKCLIAFYISDIV